MPSSEEHIRKAEKWLREVEGHMPTTLFASVAQIHATLAVARAVRESAGGAE